MSVYHVVGTMSGTSLDGLDLAWCRFERQTGGWSFEILAAETVPYAEGWHQTLFEAGEAKGVRLVEIDRAFGRFVGKEVRRFMEEHSAEVSLIASHGHTVFHQPAAGITCQIGHGAVIAQTAQTPVVADFRVSDVALGGQGAPLVPIGDRYLFGSYTSCLNLGGIANCSFARGAEQLAYDICPANQLLNHLAQHAGEAYDAGGAIAASGTVDAPLLAALDALPYYAAPFPKSLGREWFEAEVLPLLESELSVPDQLATACAHVARQVSRAMYAVAPSGTVLATGGGAFNTHLLAEMEARLGKGWQVIVPDDRLVQFKEALIFAFLGLLRWRGEVNCLRSVTGASRDHVAGAVYLA